MKKLLIISILAFFAALPVFSAAEKTIQIQTFTDEMAKAFYPNVLEKGSLRGTAVFPADVRIFENSAFMESVFGAFNITGLALKTDIGTVGVVVSPFLPFDYSLNDISVTAPSNIFSLLYATKIADLPFGFLVQYGTSSRAWTKNQDLSLGGFDYTDTASQLMGIKSSTTLSGIDVSLGVSMLNYMNTNETWASATSWTSWNQTDNSMVLVVLSGRMPLGNNFTGFADFKWLNGKAATSHKDDAPSDYTNTYTNSSLLFSALIGKDINFSESFIMKISSGLYAGGDTNGKYTHDDKLDNTLDTTGLYPFDETSYVQVPLNAAVEGSLNETWGYMLGTSLTLIDVFGNKVGQNTSTHLEKIVTLAEGSSVIIDPGMNFALGINCKIGDLRMDFNVNQQIFNKGPFFISGSALGPTAAGFACIYDWK